MATITIKNIPDDLYRDLKRAAAAHHRSINSQIIFCIENQLRSKRLDSQEFLAEARAGRRGIAQFVTDADLRAARDQGRP